MTVPVTTPEAVRIGPQEVRVCLYKDIIDVSVFARILRLAARQLGSSPQEECL